MGKPKERPKVTLPKPEDVVTAKPLMQKLAHAKARFAKTRGTLGADAKPFDPKYRAARKRVKRAQRRLRENLKYAATRQAKAAPAAGDAPATPAS